MVDSGFYNLHRFNADKGKQYENVVFLHLRRIYKELFYYKVRKEVDFCIETPKGIQLLNVSYDLSDGSIKKREIDGLTEAMDNLKTKQSLLLTKDAEDMIVTSVKQITIMPLYKWLCNVPRM
ncbi:MAG: hypothetical protein LBN98_01170 [Prevotellaceae bacterium]|nr:hypothetical protein [Prevotellaceae bacterium]